MTKPRWYERPLIAAFAFGLAFFYVHTLMAGPAGQARPGGATSTDMEREAQRVCRLVAPEADSMRVSVSAAPADGVVRQPSWEAVATDRAGEDVLCIDWYGRTGEVRAIGHLVRIPAPSGSRLSQQEALQVAWRWLRELGVSDYAVQWRVVNHPKHPRRLWAIRWQSAGHQVYVAIDDRTGALTQLFHMRDSPLPPVAVRTT